MLAFESATVLNVSNTFLPIVITLLIPIFVMTCAKKKKEDAGSGPMTTIVAGGPPKVVYTPEGVATEYVAGMLIQYTLSGVPIYNSALQPIEEEAAGAEATGSATPETKPKTEPAAEGAAAPEGGEEDQMPDTGEPPEGVAQHVCKEPDDPNYMTMAGIKEEIFDDKKKLKEKPGKEKTGKEKTEKEKTEKERTEKSVKVVKTDKAPDFKESNDPAYQTLAGIDNQIFNDKKAKTEKDGAEKSKVGGPSAVGGVSKVGGVSAVKQTGGWQPPAEPPGVKIKGGKVAVPKGVALAKPTKPAVAVAVPKKIAVAKPGPIKAVANAKPTAVAVAKPQDEKKSDGKLKIKKPENQTAMKQPDDPNYMTMEGINEDIFKK